MWKTVRSNQGRVDEKSELMVSGEVTLETDAKGKFGITSDLEHEWDKGIINTNYGRAIGDGFNNPRPNPKSTLEVVVEDLRSELPEIQDEKITSITSYLNNINDRSTDQGKLLQVSRIVLKGGIEIHELEFIKTVIGNGLESATKDGVSIINSGNMLEVRGRREDKKLVDMEKKVVLDYIKTEESRGNKINIPGRGEKTISITSGGRGNNDGSFTTTR